MHLVVTVYVALLNSLSLTLTCSEIVGGWDMVPCKKLLKCQEKPSGVYKMQKMLGGRGSALGPAGGAYRAPRTPLLVGRGLTAPSPKTPHLLSAFQASGFGFACPHPNFQPL